MTDVRLAGAPFVTIDFEHYQEPSRQPVQRHWYFVPRVGDSVELNVDTPAEEDGTPKGFMSGTVYEVLWGDPCSVVVRLR